MVALGNSPQPSTAFSSSGVYLISQSPGKRKPSTTQYALFPDSRPIPGHGSYPQDITGCKNTVLDEESNHTVHCTALPQLPVSFWEAQPEKVCFFYFSGSVNRISVKQSGRFPIVDNYAQPSRPGIINPIKRTIIMECPNLGLYFFYTLPPPEFQKVFPLYTVETVTSLTAPPV